MGTLVWFAHHLDAIAVLANLVLAAFLLVALWPSRSWPWPAAREGLLWCAVPLVLFAWRWPDLLPAWALNPDEAQMIANALKATVDPVPWRGFDPATSGPLNSDVLALPALVGAHIDFFSGRLIGLAMVALALLALYAAVRWSYDADVARVAVVPPVLFFAFAIDLDFVHYSSEHFPILLTTIGLACGAFLAGDRGGLRTRSAAAALGGMSVGCAPFAKLQAVPIAGVIGAFVVAALLTSPAARRTRPVELAAVVAGALAPAIVILGAVAVHGEWNDFLISYVYSAELYVQGATVTAAYFFGSSPIYAAFLGSAIIVVVAAGAAIVAVRGRIDSVPVASLASAVALLPASLFAIYEAHRSFPHYLLLSVVPIAWLLANLFGVAVGGLGSPVARGVAALAYAAAFVIPGVAVIRSQTNPYVAALPVTSQFPQNAVAAAIAPLAARGSRIVVWGWMPEYYVETGTIMATRDANSFYQYSAGPYRDYFRDRFMSDLDADPPVVVVDAVAPAQFSYTDEATQGIESFPRFAAYVRAHYALAADVSGVRIYARR
jgi:hypothetical protein